MQLLPFAESLPTPTSARVTTERLRELYAYPDSLVLPWVRVNFVSSIDGAVSVEGRSGGLATPADTRVFGVLRELADVILVGAGTARAEGYRGARSNESSRLARLARGQAPVPPVAVVTATGQLDTDSALFTDTAVPPLVLTTEHGEVANGERLRAAGATVLAAGAARVEAVDVLSALSALGLYRVLCEGGPTLFGGLASADLVDELCLTTSPVLAVGAAGRISAGPTAPALGMALGHVLVDEDATMLLRWVRRR